MEFLPENLARVIESGEPLELDRIAKICIQIAAGLTAAHDQGIVHRDINPHSHINPAGLAAISNGTTRCSRMPEYSGYHEC